VADRFHIVRRPPAALIVLPAIAAAWAGAAAQDGNGGRRDGRVR